MRKLTLALAIGLLAATTGFVSGPPQARAAVAHQAKVVLVVGATEGYTQNYINQATALATNHFSTYTSDVTMVFSPSATWGAVKAAAKGANILVYMGHGSGWPNPYTGGSNLQPAGDNGMGLNASAAGTHYNKKYYGEAYMAQLELAPGALVLLNHLCYASGNNDSAYGGDPTLAVAKTRVEGYASGFLRAGAGAVLADGHDDLGDLVDDIFTEHTTIESLWRAMKGFDHVISWTSGRNPNATARINPDSGLPSPGGYYSSLVHTAGLTTDEVISGQTVPFVPGSGSYYPVTPTRVVDTRGAAGSSGTLMSRGVVNYQITGTYASTGVTIPANAIAITANLTVTSQQALGYLYVGPEINNNTPPSSSLNFPKGDNRANGVTVGLSPRGTVALWYGAKAGYTTNFIIDVTGYFVAGTAGAGYVPFGPQRVLDTRDGTGGLSGPFVHSQARKIQIAGEVGLPSSGIVAVAGNITVVHPSAKGYVYLGPDPVSHPTSSTINFPAYDTRANNVVVPVNADGTVAATYWAVAGASVDIVLDISGYFISSGGRLLYTTAPARILDTRDGTGLSGLFVARQPRTLQVTGEGGVPTGAVALVGNLTVTQQSALGFAAVGPAITPESNFSNLNFPKGDNRANGITVPLTAQGKVDLVYVARPGNTCHLIVDVFGYYMGTA
jgi:hypothetical protein